MGTVDPRERFTSAAHDYARHRPSYPGGLVDRVLAEAGVGPGDPVADVGCGTGILTTGGVLAFPYRTVALVFQLGP